MNISGPFIRRPVMTVFVMLSILLLGLLAFRKLPVSDLPSVDYPMIHVFAGYSGASPETMSKKVTVPLEKELMNISGVDHIYSSSGRGSTSITLLFNLSKNIDDAAQDVQAALAKAAPNLPNDLDTRPAYAKAQAHREDILYLMLTSSTTPLSDLYDFAHSYVEPLLARVDGVGQVNVYGSPYAVRIQLNPQRMAARGICFDDVLMTVKQATSNLPLGVLKTDTRKLSIELPASLKKAQDFENLTLSCQNPLATAVRLKEVADVLDDRESDDIFYHISKDSRSLAVILGIQRQSGANTVKISKEVAKLLPKIDTDLPPAVSLKLWFDKAQWIGEAVLDVEETLLLGFVLVVVVIFLSLGRVTETIIPSLVLPLSIVGTFIAMWALGFSLDILSLLALTLSVGFIIDDAIVVLENIVRHHENGSTAVEAALKGSKQIGFTIVSMTLSLIAVFIPLLFRGDITGRLFREFSMTLVISIAISAFISLTLTPLLCSKFLSSHQKETLVQKWATRWNQALLRFYDKTLKWCFRFRKTTLLAAAVSFGATIFLFRFVSVDLFPEEDRSFIWCAANLPKGISKEKTEQFESKIVAILRENPYIDSFLSLSFYGQQMFLMQLPPGNKRPPQATLIAEMQKQINSIPGVLAFIKGVQLISPGMGSHSGSKYQYILRGLNLEELQASAEKLKSALQALPEFPSVHVDLELNDPKLMIELFDEEIEKLGLSKQAVQHLLQQAYSGASIGKIEKETDQYKVFVELAPEFQKKPDSLSDLYLRTSEGISVPLKALARWKETVGLPSIPHIDLLPSATLSFDIAEGVALNKGLELLQRTAQATLPGSISAKLEGTAELIESTVRDTVLLIILAVVAMYIVLGILYESFLHPLTILSSLPLASLGGILTLLIFKEPLSLYSMIGFILLIGIVKKNGIMMVDHAIEVRKTKESSPFEAIYEACLVRLRPIMMTTIAAIMGALPIAIGIGAGADTRRGLGLVIAGGLLFSQLLTLYVTPIIYLYLETLKEKTR